MSEQLITKSPTKASRQIGTSIAITEGETIGGTKTEIGVGADLTELQTIGMPAITQTFGTGGVNGHVGDTKKRSLIKLLANEEVIRKWTTKAYGEIEGTIANTTGETIAETTIAADLTELIGIPVITEIIVAPIGIIDISRN